MATIFKLVFSALIITAPLLTQAGAASLPDAARESIIDQGIPAEALDTALQYLYDHEGRTVAVQHKDRSRKQPVMITKNILVRAGYMGIVDFSKPSEEPRFFLLNLQTNHVQTFLVSQGRNSGVRWGYRFGNTDMSKMSSLGMYLTGETYTGGHGVSINLYGLDASNNMAAMRDVVLHGADYSTARYIQRRGRLGRSWGCAAVSSDDFPKVLAAMQPGSVLYLYHPSLMSAAKQSPLYQETAPPEADDQAQDFPDEEEGIQNSKH